MYLVIIIEWECVTSRRIKPSLFSQTALERGCCTAFATESEKWPNLRTILYKETFGNFLFCANIAACFVVGTVSKNAIWIIKGVQQFKVTTPFIWRGGSRKDIAASIFMEEYLAIFCWPPTPNFKLIRA